MPDVKISAGADPVTLVATDKVPMARSASTTAYAATMAELATYANGAYTPNYFAGTPSMDSVGAPGSAAFVSRGDHVHPTDTTRVAKGGDTMTGLLTLSGAPTSNLHAATKLYVDGSAPVGGPYLPLAGGILTGALTPAQVPGLVGTTTNNNAAAGAIGEYVASTILVGSAVALTSGTAANVTSISLTAGDWDVRGNVAGNAAGTTVVTSLAAWTNTASAAPPTPPGNGGETSWVGSVTGNAPIVSAGVQRLSLASTTTVYLGVFATFATSTLTAYGFVGARRVR